MVIGNGCERSESDSAALFEFQLNKPHVYVSQMTVHYSVRCLVGKDCQSPCEFMAVSHPAVGGHRKRPSTSTDHLHTEEVACPSCHNHYVFSEEGRSCFVWLSCATCSFRCKCWWMSSVSLRFVSHSVFLFSMNTFWQFLFTKHARQLVFRLVRTS